MPRRIIILFVMIAITTNSVFAGTRAFGVHGIGPRAGVTIDPDQIHFGGHLDLGDFAPQLMIFPEVEIGIDDDLTVIAPMFDIAYRFRDNWGSWNPYLGAGIGPVFTSFDRGGDDTSLGMSIQGGVQKRLTSQSGFMFLEFKLGVVDYPDVKFTLGWCFGSK